MWMAIGLLATLALVLGFIALVLGLIKPSILRQPSRSAAFVKAAGVMAVSMVVLVIAAVSDQREKKPPQTAEASSTAPAATAPATVPPPAPPTIEQTLKGASKRIADVELRQQGGGTHVTFRHRTTSTWSESSFINDVALDLWVALKKATAAHGGEISGYSVIVEGPTIDRYGNSSTDEMLTLAFTGDDMRKVNWSSTNTWVLLNLSKPAFQPVGRRVALTWCGDESNRRYGREFCTNIVR